MAIKEQVTIDGRRGWIKFIAPGDGKMCGICGRRFKTPQGRSIHHARNWIHQGLEAERAAVIRIMRDGQGKVDPVMSPEEARQAISGRGLTQGQQDAITLVLTSADRVIGIEGYPDVMKSTLKTIREQLEARGYSITICDQSVRRAAYTDRAEDGIRADFVIVDDVVASRLAIHGILARAEAQGSRVVLVGDTEQLPAILKAPGSNAGGRIGETIAAWLYDDMRAAGMATADARS